MKNIDLFYILEHIRYKPFSLSLYKLRKLYTCTSTGFVGFLCTIIQNNIAGSFYHATKLVFPNKFSARVALIMQRQLHKIIPASPKLLCNVIKQSPKAKDVKISRHFWQHFDTNLSNKSNKLFSGIEFSFTFLLQETKDFTFKVTCADFGYVLT